MGRIAQVLIAERDPEQALHWATTFKNTGLQPRPVTDDNELLELVTHERPRVLIHGQSMDLSRAFEITRYLRETEKYGALPILLQRASPEFEECETALALGYDDVLAAPVSPPEIVRRIHSHLRASRMREELLLRANNAEDEWTGTSEVGNTLSSKLEIYIDRRLEQLRPELSAELAEVGLQCARRIHPEIRARIELSSTPHSPDRAKQPRCFLGDLETVSARTKTTELPYIVLPSDVDAHFLASQIRFLIKHADQSRLARQQLTSKARRIARVCNDPEQNTAPHTHADRLIDICRLSGRPLSAIAFHSATESGTPTITHSLRAADFIAMPDNVTIWAILVDASQEEITAVQQRIMKLKPAVFKASATAHLRKSDHAASLIHRLLNRLMLAKKSDVTR